MAQSVNEAVEEKDGKLWEGHVAVSKSTPYPTKSTLEGLQAQLIHNVSASVLHDAKSSHEAANSVLQELPASIPGLINCNPGVAGLCLTGWPGQGDAPQIRWRAARSPVEANCGTGAPAQLVLDGHE